MSNTYFTETQLKSIEEEFLNHTENNLYISLKTIFKWLDCPNFYDIYINDKDFKEEICQRTIYKLQADEFIMELLYNVETPSFSVEGFKKFCQLYNEKSKYLGNYLGKNETQNKNNKYDTLAKNTLILAKTIEIMKKEINYLNREVDYLKQEVRNNRRD